MSLYRCECEGEVVYAEAGDTGPALSLAWEYFSVVGDTERGVSIAVDLVSEDLVLRAAAPEEKT